MDRRFRHTRVDTLHHTSPRSLRETKTAVGASYAFEPGADGLAGIYASRLLARGVDSRALCADVRADRLGLADRAVVRRALSHRTRTSHIGRGTAHHLLATSAQQSGFSGHVNGGTGRSTAALPAPGSRHFGVSRWPRRLVAAGLALMLLLPLGVIAANAQEAPIQSRYVVQEGDTLEGVAAQFGVAADAILAASAVQNPPWLTPAEVIVIPAPWETPDEAVGNAQQRAGTSPFVSGAHVVASGETLATISAIYGTDPWTLASLNGIGDVDTLSSGQLLRIPAVDPVVAAEAVPADAQLETWTAAEEEGVGGVWQEPVFAADVPAYLQAYPLSCEYAAAYIATAGFGWGVPESAFMERIGLSANPHWGYRGDITGGWGGVDNYGVYPEAMVATLNEFGYVADVFYGGDASSLTARIDSGMPVLAWLGYFGDTAWLQEDEGAYLLAPGMHVVTVYGYDAGGVYVSNPGRGNYDYYDWDSFLSMWQVLDGMALGIAPM